MTEVSPPPLSLRESPILELKCRVSSIFMINNMHEEITQFWLVKINAVFSNSVQKRVKTNMVKPRKRWFHFIESGSDTDWTIPWAVYPDFELFCALKMWRYNCILLFWSYAIVLTERTVWINYFCTWCARFAYA